MEPDAIRNRSEYPIWPAAPVTATFSGDFIEVGCWGEAICQRALRPGGWDNIPDPLLVAHRALVGSERPLCAARRRATQHTRSACILFLTNASVSPSERTLSHCSLFAPYRRTRPR